MQLLKEVMVRGYGIVNNRLFRDNWKSVSYQEVNNE